MDKPPKILFVASEIYPFSKSGGLADVMGILPLTLHGMGYSTAVITPFYGRMSTSDYPLRLVFERMPVGYPWPDVTADVYRADYNGMPVFFVDRPEYFDRRNYYCTYKGDYFDNCERFIFFSRAALTFARRMRTIPRIIHANDWHAALVPAYLNFWRRSDPAWAGTFSALAIHNLAFQGQYSFRLFMESGLPHEAWNMEGAEFYGSFNMLKTGIAYADMITTVSPSYAQEILTPEFGSGLEGILSKRAGQIRGVLNGADYTVWDPSTDKFLDCRYSVRDLQGKRLCKHSLLQKMGMSPAFMDRPVLGFIGRLREQKGIDLLLDIMPWLMELNLGVVVLGEGGLEHEARLENLVEQYPGQLSACIGYTEELSHQIQAGADIFLMPSRYEPCGLTQLYSLRYGTPPVATAVGGLKDTILAHPHPEATGFIFQHPSPGPFLEAIEQAVLVWEDAQAWRAMLERAMRCEFSWQKSASDYITIYKEMGAGL